MKSPSKKSPTKVEVEKKSHSSPPKWDIEKLIDW